MKHVFVDGPIATGNAFFGRREMLDRLRSEEQDAVSLVGPTRIGKSSLVEELLSTMPEDPNRIILKFSLGSFESAYHFWQTLWSALHEELSERGAWTAVMERFYCRFADKRQDEEWYSKMSNNLPNVLKLMQKTGLKWYLVLDEFDAVLTLFEENEHYYQFLRDIFYNSYRAAGIVISRRTVQELETQSTSLSNLHGIFTQESLGVFNDADMEEFYDALAEYGLQMTENGRTAVMEVTGGLPRLCCKLARELILQHPEGCLCGAHEIMAAYAKIIVSVLNYYDDLIRRLRADNHWNAVLNLCLGSEEILNNKHLKDRMLAMGYLRKVQTENGVRYVAYSDEFMQYLISQPLDEAPLWNTLMGAERMLKLLAGTVYPVLAGTTVTALGVLSLPQTQVDAQCDGVMSMIWGSVLKNAAKNSARAGKDTPLTDALSMDNLVIMIRNKWNRFGGWFGWEEEWKNRLSTIQNVRNPFGHAHGDYLTKEEIRVAERNCLDLIALLKGQIS